MTIDDILNAIHSPTLKDGATPEVIHKLEEAVGAKLPVLYIQLLMRTNGLDGFLGDNYIIFYDADLQFEWNRAYDPSIRPPELWIFGSNGGGTGYTFNVQSSPMKVVSIDFICFDYETSQPMGDSFEAFIEKLST